MHQLHQLLAGDEDLQEIVSTLGARTMGNPLKHAIVLDFNPFWLAAYRLAEAGLSPDALRLSGLGAMWPWQIGQGGPVDVHRNFEPVDGLTQTYFGRRRRNSPYMLRIFASPAKSAADQSFRRSLFDAAVLSAVPTVVETEEPPRLIASLGDRVTSGSKSGTLGGFLRDGPGGSSYGVTCGHVVAKGGAASTRSGALGPCTHAEPPKPLPSGVVCTGTCGHLANLDVALIDLHGAPATNAATSVAPLVANGDLVEMRGATTKTMTYEVGGAVVELSVGGSCWDRLFVIHAPTAGVLPISVNVAAHPIPQPGDSGAWLLRNKTEWAGMVVASGGLHGYALAATQVIAESNSAFGTALQLL